MNIDQIKKLTKNKNIRYSVLGLIIFAVLLFSASNYWQSKLPTLYSVLGNDFKEINELKFYKLTFEFKKLSDILKYSSKENQQKAKKKQFFVHRTGKDLWYCDPILNTAYRSLPVYDFLKKDYIIRIIPDKIPREEINDLNGIYVCACYISDKPYKTALTNVVVLNVNKLIKIPFPIFLPSNKPYKYVKHEPASLEKLLWLDFIKKHFPNKPIPAQKDNKTFLAHSVPQGLEVYTAQDYEIESCILGGKLSKPLLISRIINKKHFRGLSPTYAEYKLHTKIYVLYNFVSTSKDLLNDGYAFEFIEPIPNKTNMYRILRAYKMDFMAAKHINIINCAMFQIKGLSADQIINYIGGTNTFEFNEDLFDLYIEPVLKQAAVEKADPSFDIKRCRKIIAHAGKLNIETLVGNYLMSISRTPSHKNSIQTYGKCINLLMKNKKVIQELPNFFYKN